MATSHNGQGLGLFDSEQAEAAGFFYLFRSAAMTHLTFWFAVI